MAAWLTTALERRGAYVAFIAVWLATVAVGAAIVGGYETEPGTPAAPPAEWPAASALRRRDGLPTVVVFVHPRCPCTRATLSELNVVMNRMQRRAVAHVVVMRPTDRPGRWTRAGNWTRAKEIPGVTVVADADGAEARRFGVATSGQALVYDRDGRLRFSGGITAMRGHEGDNAGRRLLLAALSDERGGETTSRVYGCAMFARGREP